MLRNEEGSALALTLFTIVILSVLTIGISNSIVNEIKATSTEKDQMQAHYIAEAGIEKAIYDIKAGDIQLGVNQPLTLSDDEQSALDKTNSYYKITDGEDSNYDYRIEAHGEVNDITKTITVICNSSGYGGLFDYSVFSEGDVTFKNNTDLYIDKLGRGGIYTKGNVTSGVHLYVHDTPNNPEDSYEVSDLYNSKYINVDKEDKLSFFDFDINYLKQIKDEDYPVSENKLNTKKGLDLKIEINGDRVVYMGGENIYIGNLDLISDGEGGILFVDGNLELKNDTDIKNYIVIVTGNIILKNNLTMQNGLLYSKGNISEIKNNSNITGTVAAKNGVNFKNNTTLTFDNSYISILEKYGLLSHSEGDNSSNGLEIISWKEN